MSPTLTSGKATTGPCWPLCVVECPWSGVEHGRACTSVKLEALVNARGREGKVCVAGPPTGTWGAGLCIRGWKEVSPQKNLQVATAGGEATQKEATVAKKVALQSNFDHAGIFKLSPSLSGVAKHC